MKTSAAIAVFLITVRWAALAAPPQLDAIFPAGGQRGQQVEVELIGKFSPWPCELDFSENGFSFVPNPEKAGRGTIHIPGDFASGAVAVRAHNAEGATSPVFFVVDDTPEILEEEKDESSVSKSVTVDTGKLPLVINGILAANHELDSFGLSLKKGQTLCAAVEGYTLRSPIDPALHVYDENGNRLLLAHDSANHLDPRIEFPIPHDGDFVVAIAGFSHPPATSVDFRGDKKSVYRLHLALRRDDLPKRLLPEDPGPDAKTEELPAGKAIAGTLSKKSETDSYRFPTKKGETWFVAVEARALGYPTDPVLHIRKPDGSTVRTEDDTNKEPDPSYTWKVAADGEYEIAVEDRFRDGGKDYRYRLSANQPNPDFTATVEKATYVLERAKPLDIKVKIERTNGHTAKLSFSIPDLPPSFKLTPPEKVPEKNGDVILKLEAAKDALAFSGPLQLKVTDEPGEEKREPIEHIAKFSFRDDNWRGPYVIETLDQSWLTLPPPKEEKKKEEDKKPEKE